MIMAIRRCRQKPTNLSIIEQDPAPHHDLLARAHTRSDGDRSTLFQLRLDDTPLESPWCDGHEYAGPVVVHEQRRAREDDARLLRPEQRDRREHVRLERMIRVREREPQLVAARV